MARKSKKGADGQAPSDDRPSPVLPPDAPTTPPLAAPQPPSDTVVSPLATEDESAEASPDGPPTARSVPSVTLEAPVVPPVAASLPALPAPYAPQATAVVTEAEAEKAPSAPPKAEMETKAETQVPAEPSYLPPVRQPAPVVVGKILRCTNFEGDRGVAGRVHIIHPTQPMILLFILGLGIYWPITDDDVRGDMWVHHPGNYPPPGTDADFDERCRTPHPPNVNPLISLTARRSARSRYAWARVTTNIGALGFALDGAEKTRWKGPANQGEKGELGEFPIAVLKDNPSCFVVDETDED